MAALEKDSECLICRLPLSIPIPFRANICPFCERSFKRVDAKRRHTKTCPARGDRALPPAAKRGRKSRACDECSRLKVSCNGQIPCQRCSSRHLVCASAHVCRDPAHLNDQIQHEANLHLSQGFSSLCFLLNCTDPRVNFMNDVLVAGEPESNQATPATWDTASPSDIGDGTVDPQALFLAFMDPYFSFSLYSDGNDDNEVRSTDMAMTLPIMLEDSISARVDLLRADLQQLLNNTRPHFNYKPHQGLFDKFFIYDNFRRLLSIFFRKPQLLARMIHWPSFDPNKVDLSLLLAIALCGAAYSYKSSESPEYASIIDLLRELADKYVFRRLKQYHAYDHCGTTLEICQAAYLMIMLQMAVNDGEARRRAISKRQPALVDVLRRLGMFKTLPELQPQMPEWSAFVHRESCVRLITFVLFNDGLMALFCNSPPTTTVLEMVGGLPCRDELWEANCQQSFEIEQSKDHLNLSYPCMRDVLRSLMNDDWEGSSTANLDSLSVFHLYATIGAFQFILFNYRANILQDSLKSVLLRALSRWEQLWNAAIERVSTEEYQWLGVAKYSPEFALISRRIIETRDTEEGNQSKYLQCTSEYDLAIFHEFILQHGLC